MESTWLGQTNYVVPGAVEDTVSVKIRQNNRVLLAEKKTERGYGWGCCLSLYDLCPVKGSQGCSVRISNFIHPKSPYLNVEALIHTLIFNVYKAGQVNIFAEIWQVTELRQHLQFFTQKSHRQPRTELLKSRDSQFLEPSLPPYSWGILLCDWNLGFVSWIRGEMRVSLSL